MVETYGTGTYTSNHGWRISLPAGWERLLDSGLKTVTLCKPEVFADANDSDLCITWMPAGHPIADTARGAFNTLTEVDGRLETATALPIIQSVFPLIGELEQADSLTLPGGMRALETIEVFSSSEDEGEQRGYQLIFQRQGASAPRFERFCFYAPADEFARNIDKVRKATRSIEIW